MTAVRKHIYLITEHRDEEKVGLFKITDTRLQDARKNEERRTKALDRENEAFFDYKVVGLGYVDFDNEEDYKENAVDEIERKMAEIDEEHLEKAGHNPPEVSGE